jgi:ABC-type bacteriocin/lantibiotic exporter with double-glycine peptidase domain
VSLTLLFIISWELTLIVLAAVFVLVSATIMQNSMTTKVITDYDHSVARATGVFASVPKAL